MTDSSEQQEQPIPQSPAGVVNPLAGFLHGIIAAIALFVLTVPVAAVVGYLTNFTTAVDAYVIIVGVGGLVICIGGVLEVW